MHMIAGWESEFFPRFEAFLLTRGGPFRLPLAPPYPPISMAPGEGLHGGLLEGSCGRRRRRGMTNRQNVGESAYLLQKDETPFISYPKAVRQKLLLAEVSNQSVFETRNYVCLKTLSSTRVTIKTDRFFDRRVGLPRLHRAGFARRPTR